MPRRQHRHLPVLLFIATTRPNTASQPSAQQPRRAPGTSQQPTTRTTLETTSQRLAQQPRRTQGTKQQPTTKTTLETASLRLAQELRRTQGTSQQPATRSTSKIASQPSAQQPRRTQGSTSQQPTTNDKATKTMASKTTSRPSAKQPTRTQGTKQQPAREQLGPIAPAIAPANLGAWGPPWCDTTVTTFGSVYPTMSPEHHEAIIQTDDAPPAPQTMPGAWGPPWCDTVTDATMQPVFNHQKEFYDYVTPRNYPKQRRGGH
ncbi:uncharacterized protein AB675_11618 [Cyphellophora attinorum]|uniref:Uncharacterized protein n=1 Tax=Cyphellophora attinorum TaxID=1664694 RepID=A0A0N1H312_9EURO|nr:uncharacterized protein AB675_11618 [Phialophora attinorum]KPI34646.1 hypothetical protein AB675_11618 [Phialophora attinorum]